MTLIQCSSKMFILNCKTFFNLNILVLKAAVLLPGPQVENISELLLQRQNLSGLPSKIDPKQIF